jgi:DNA replication protein DnaC
MRGCWLRLGTGKNFVAQAVGFQAIKQGFTVLYRSIFDVVRDFEAGPANRLRVLRMGERG